jgi:hypothetical protein
MNMVTFTLCLVQTAFLLTILVGFRRQKHVHLPVRVSKKSDQ